MIDVAIVACNRFKRKIMNMLSSNVKDLIKKILKNTLKRKENELPLEDH